MTKVTFIESGGRLVAIDVPEGCSLMQAATSNGVLGIAADCGGACACATCHGYVEGDAAKALDAPNATEAAMLEGVAVELRTNSRLGCQINAIPGLEGLVSGIAEHQE